MTNKGQGTKKRMSSCVFASLLILELSVNLSPKLTVLILITFVGTGSSRIRLMLMDEVLYSSRLLMKNNPTCAVATNTSTVLVLTLGDLYHSSISRTQRDWELFVISAVSINRKNRSLLWSVHMRHYTLACNTVTCCVDKPLVPNSIISTVKRAIASTWSLTDFNICLTPVLMHRLTEAEILQ